MINLATPQGKYFFSDFVTVLDGQIVELDETVLKLTQIDLLFTGITNRRIVLSAEDLDKLKLAYEVRKGEGAPAIENPSIPPTSTATLLEGKEDKVNKVDTLTSPSLVEYPTTKAVIEYVATVTNSIDNLRTTFSLELETKLANKLDANILATLATKAELTPAVSNLEQTLSNKQDKLLAKKPTTLAKTANKIPMYTLDNGGNYILCTPDKWVEIEDGFVIPVYKKSLVGIAE